MKHYDLFEDAKESSLDAVRKSIYCISNCIFSSNEEDIKYFSGQKKDDKELVIKKCGSIKPCIHGSDAHTEDKLFSPDQNRYCWIKADPTFEGLKQIVYEPEPCERVCIGPIEPDQKDGYKVIRNIKFKNTNDFPEEIEFNKNLCSIIGSRSSGKSALLAYVAHSVDKKRTESMIKGPGEGENYHWNKITFDYKIEWAIGQSNDESPGKIVYIPQNYLFKQSKDPDEIKEKIAPILFKVLPDFETRYLQTESNINAINQRISDYIDDWFALSDTIQTLDNTLRDLGDKNAVEKDKKELNSKIEKLKEQSKLSEDDIVKYKEITADISAYESRITLIKSELSQISDVSSETNFFKTLKITPSPALENLPKKLRDRIMDDLTTKESDIISEINKQVLNYKESIKSEEEDIKAKIVKISKDKDNRVLMETYQKNAELEELVRKINEHIITIQKIDDTVIEKQNSQNKLNEYEKTIKSEIEQRKSFLEQLKSNIDDADQSSIKCIKFGLEFGFDESLNIVTQKINTRDKSEFIEKGSLKIEDIRNNLAGFLSAIYSGKQKVNSGNDKKEVTQEILSLTEKILFTAEMEGDKIGGFSEPTMTPGKRALFALRLILDESEDTWPLLIDQPEDDLDSRSVYAEIVPFLKEKKRERQIILVSHNANLVIGADSEQIIVANRNGDDRKNKDGKQFNYLTGSIEYTKEKVKGCEDTLDAQGIREHACEILDGGKTAFENREKKYGFKS
ncbi:MAG: TrlF family AAA-like ATPase [Nitrospirota bacterium]